MVCQIQTTRKLKGLGLVVEVTTAMTLRSIDIAITIAITISISIKKGEKR